MQRCPQVEIVFELDTSICEQWMAHDAKWINQEDAW